MVEEAAAGAPLARRGWAEEARRLSRGPIAAIVTCANWPDVTGARLYEADSNRSGPAFANVAEELQAIQHRVLSKNSADGTARAIRVKVNQPD